MKDEFEKKALQFLIDTNTFFNTKWLKFDKYFEGDKEPRDIYEITLQRGERKFVFAFGQSITNSGYKFINTNTEKEIKYIWQKEIINECKNDRKRFWILAKEKLGSLGGLRIVEPKSPNAYDVLSCLQKHEVGTFEDFCEDFGYDEDSRNAEKTYKAICNEYDNIKMLWNDEEIEQLQEIN